MSARKIAIIGGGPAGLMAAETCAKAGCQVVVYDRMPSIGRKFLMAGRGGLNLTHSEELPRFLTRYRIAEAVLSPAIADFGPDALRQWSADLGEETFIGSSGRVFPRAMKASPLLRAWLRRLDGLGVHFRLKHDWKGWNEAGELTFETPDGLITTRPDATILATGGASWPKLGADGRALSVLAQTGITTHPFQPANCGFLTAWSPVFQERFAGEPLKRISLTFRGETVQGEVMITTSGLEGGAIYALSAPLRDAILQKGQADLWLDLKPDFDRPTLMSRFSQPRGKQSLSSFLRKSIGLSPAAIGLLNEAAFAQSRRLASFSPERLAVFVKACPIVLTGIAPMERAISSAGGVAFDALDSSLMIKERPGVFVAGEMLDWEAPTGGYLLQACFATGRQAALGALEHVLS